jgi:hypothetical protein
MFYTVPYPKIEFRHSISLYNWLEDNCRGKFYTGYDWDSTRPIGESKRIVQFENEKDAVMFALKWT